MSGEIKVKSCVTRAGEATDAAGGIEAAERNMTLCGKPTMYEIKTLAGDFAPCCTFHLNYWSRLLAEVTYRQIGQ